MKSALSLLAVLAMASGAFADVRLPRLFSDHMVMQRGRPLHVWGWADPGEAVIVSLSGKRVGVQATADDHGRFSLHLPAMDASGPHVLTVAGKNEVSIQDVMIGEVWIGSGQSNMEWPLARARDAEAEIAAANDPMLRLLEVPRTRAADAPRDDVNASWALCTSESAREFSAVLYFFGRHLRERYPDVAIGLIQSAWGGTPAEHWTPKERFEQVPALLATNDQPRSKKVMEQRSSLWNGMIAPLVPYPVAGVTWYQGEANVQMHELYGALFRNMIQAWRAAWQRDELPFLFVQLAPYRYGNVDPTWCARLRDAQASALELDNTGMAVTMDIGNPKDIHPRNKQDVGERLGLLARKIAYGEDVVCRGPHAVSAEIVPPQAGDSGGPHVTVRVRFEGVDSWTLVGNQQALPFELEVDGEVVSDEGRHVMTGLPGQAILTWPLPSQGRATAIRFAWADDAQVQLFNSSGLPAEPFRIELK